MSDVEVRPSGIEGLGVFAVRSFKAGERIRQVNVVREVTPEAPIREDLGERIDHCNYPDGKVVLYGPPDRHLNHSCDPNAYEVFAEDATFLVARKDIAPGTEITCDYNINIANGTAWPCRCGATRCQGEVVGDFFRLPKLWQREYRPLLAGWFVRQHRERIEALDRELPGSARRVQQALAAAGIAAHVLELPQSTRTASDAAAAIGCRVEQIAKSLVFRRADSGLPVLVVASGTNRVDERLVSSHLNTDIAKADADFVRSTTGFAIGGVPPLGHALPIQTLIDEDLLRLDTIWAAAGTPHAVFSLNPQQLVRATGGHVLPVSTSHLPR